MDRRSWQEKFRSGFNKTKKKDEQERSEKIYMDKLDEKSKKKKSMFQGIKNLFNK